MKSFRCETTGCSECDGWAAAALRGDAEARCDCRCHQPPSGDGKCETQLIVAGGDVFRCSHQKDHSPVQPHRAMLDGYNRSPKNDLTETIAWIEWKDRK